MKIIEMLLESKNKSRKSVTKKLEKYFNKKGIKYNIRKFKVKKTTKE